MNAQRIATVRKHLSALRLDALLVTSLPHIRYLTGFSGSNACCVITDRSQVLLTDGRYKTQVKEETKGFRTFITGKGLFEEAKARKVIPIKGRLGFSAPELRVSELENLKTLFPKARFVKTRNIVGSIAAVKDESEIEKIRRAVAVSDEVFKAILPVLKEGITELDIAAEIVYQHRRRGAEADAFEPIVASGVRGALPHARATAKKIRSREFVTLDFGCRLQGYHSDLTRTVAVGTPGDELRTMYEVVKESQQRALDAARSGMKARDLDSVARKRIKTAGYGKYFPHSLGHGLGLEVHEMPRVSALSTDILQSGNVVTIEPGIYVPNFGGVRIEDDVVIREQNAEILTASPKELMIL
ncbi:MAG TPA: Xaa-Pro peptidase family protein [Bacteroidota bacterium]